MDSAKVTPIHSSCPSCHLPVREEQCSIIHDGRSYHMRCSPVAEISSAKDNVYPQRIAI